MRVGAYVFSFLVLVNCELPTSKSMGHSGEAANVSTWMLVSISLEVLHDRLQSTHHVPFCYRLQG